MDDSQTKSGDALIRYFMHRTDLRLDSMDSKLDDLFRFRWIVAGIQIGAGTLIGFAIAIFLKII